MRRDVPVNTWRPLPGRMVRNADDVAKRDVRQHREGRRKHDRCGFADGDDIDCGGRFKSADELGVFERVANKTAGIDGGQRCTYDGRQIAS